MISGGAADQQCPRYGEDKSLFDSCDVDSGPLLKRAIATDRKVAVYCADDGTLLRVRGALATWTISRHFRRWSDACDVLLHDIPLVAIVPRIGRQESGLIAGFREQRPRQPIVVVTHQDANNVRLLAPLGIEEIVWISETEATLSGAINRVRDSCFFVQLADRIGHAENLDPLIRAALTAAILRPRPIVSVCELADIVASNPGTLRRRWKKSKHDGNDDRLEDIIAWLVLVRAVQRRRFEGAWHMVAEAVGVDARTLSRLARRLMHMSLREVESCGFSTVADQCHQEFRRAGLASNRANEIARKCAILSLARIGSEP